MKNKSFEEDTFENLKFSGEVFENCEFTDCVFINCTFEDCRLSGCSLVGCRLDGCTVTNLKAEKFSRAQFTELCDCRITTINWGDLLGGKFAEPISSLEGCLLKYNTFPQMNFKKFSFSGNTLSFCTFADCALSESSFKGCDLSKTEFFQCDLRKADFREASGYQVDITSCKMQNSRFSSPEAINLLGVLKIKID